MEAVEILQGMLTKLLDELGNPWLTFLTLMDGQEEVITACYICGCMVQELNPINNEVVFGHTPECAWVMAMTMLGRNIVAVNHAVYLGEITNGNTGD